jgi:cytochrome c peroxidase
VDSLIKDGNKIVVIATEQIESIESFVLTLTSFDSKFDRALKGERQLTAAEKRGFELFMTEYDPRRDQFGADCFHCHGGPLFQSQTFASNGLDSEFADPGRAKITGNDSDHGKFATPSLRNIALTAPYMHDGRVPNARRSDRTLQHRTGTQRDIGSKFGETFWRRDPSE